ncbi:hypothetical protein M409DRAFT_19839 [Zasmidium cellare ATCC 36951]|uniref:Uncharacterized protein n=1 Tax=Zasmidium cellare ATCC 36951 TaxID=1080233 RepID=A0A6A6CSH9_ZASCE|nr:uncharacterized protein M409DRAFT_19839 [Zasmidium cellare ATCC 36951]KAF2170237.1 hypothetical protein M409DRAFT_19839 [Zasmidium cellare ATCC 36951]
MPPVTPSPHRFLAGQRRQPSPSKDAKRLRALRRLQPEERETTPQRKTPAPAPSPGQFAAAPRFGFGRPSPARQSSPPKPSLAEALRTSSRPVEDVDEAQGHEDDDDEMLMCDDEEAQAVPTTEDRLQDVQQWANALPYSPKRRRLDDVQTEPQQDASIAVPPKPVFKHPTTPASHMNTGAHTFSRAGSVASTIGTENGAAGIRRPQFLRSSVAPSEQLEPLPEAFSPHRRGEKFVPGGLAATMQQWVIETGQAAAHSRKGQGYLNGEDYVLRAKVSSVAGRGPMLVQGRHIDGGDVRLMLVADSKKDAIIDIPVGSTVGVRAPTWDIELEGISWTVGVDWKVLQQR